MNNKLRFALTTAISFFGMHGAAQAELPDLVGSWSGGYTGTYSTCTGTDNDGRVAGSQVIVSQAMTINQQDGASVTGSFTTSSADWQASTFNFSAQVDDSGRFIAFTSDAGDVEAYVFNFETNTVTYNGGVEVSRIDTAGNVTGVCELTAPTTTLTGTAIGAFIDPVVDALVVAPVDEPEPLALPSSEIVNNSVVLQANVYGITNSILSRAKDALRGSEGGFKRYSSGINLSYEAETGLAAGSSYDSLSAWGGYSRTEMDNESTLTAFDGHRNNIQGGFDFSPKENVIVGLSFGNESTSIETDFNKGDYDANGYTIAPYIAYLINDNSNVDLVVGYTGINVKQSRLDLAGTQITSDFDADRLFVAGNVNLFKQFDRLDIGADLGFIWAKESQDSYSESNGNRIANRDIEIGQILAGANISYMINNYFQPYSRITYFRDVVSDDSVRSYSSSDNDDSVFSAGLRFYSDVGVTGNFEWTTRIGRENLDEDVYSFNVRVDL